jgi:DNA-binding winged helix-turn-helix (wHTH) protein
MAAPRALRFGAYRLDLVNQCLLRDGDVVPLAPKPFALLCYLVANPGRLVTKDELLDAVWPDAYVGDAVLKVAVGKVRRALGDEGSEGGAVATVSRKGYRFVLEVAPDAGDARAVPASQSPAAIEPAVSSLPSPGTQRSRAVQLVGRDGDLSALDACRERALGGERQVVFVTGEAGIGKSTIIDAWIANRLDARARVGRGQCLDHFGGSEAYLPVLEALSSLARGDDGAHVIEALRRVAPSWLAQMPWLVDEEARVALQQELAGATRERMLREIAELIEELGRDRLLVLVLEDLHWSDPSTLDVLSFAAQRRSPARLLLIGSYRPVDAVVAEHAIRDVKHRLQARQLCSEIALGYLAEEDIERYAALRLGAPPPRALAPLLHQRTSCSPLFVASVVDHLLARRLLVEADGVWRLAAPADEIAREVPEGLRGMIERQVEALDAAEVSVVEAGAVAGAEFSAALAAAATGLALDEVEVRCEQLAARGGLIRGAGVAPSGDGLVSGRYAFVHALHRNVVYQRTPPARRQRLHKRLGAWLEAHGASPGELAHHFLVAGLPDDLAKAMVYAQHAAERARAVFAYDEAARHHGTALRAAEARGGLSDAERCILLLEHAEALEHAAAIDRAEESFQRAVEIARRLDDPDLFARAVLGFGSRYGRLRADPAMVAALEEALARVGERAAPSVRARLLSRLEFCLSAEPGPAVLARRADVRADLRRVQRKLDDPATEIWVARCTRWAFAGPQTQREIEGGLARLDALLPRLTQPEDHMSVRLLRVLDLLELGRTDEVDAELAVLDAEVARTPIGWFAWFVLRYKALLALLRGELEAAARLTKEAVAVGESTEHPHIRPTYLLQRFALRRLRGEDARPDVELLAAAQVAQWQPLLLHARALAGQRDEARAGLAEIARDEFAAIPENTLFLLWMGHLAQVCALVEDERCAPVLLRLLEPYADRFWGVGAGAVVLGHGGRYVGLLHATLGSVAAATRHFERAIAENERARALPWLAATQVDLARLLLAPAQGGRDTRARGLALAEAARASATRLGMRQLALDAATLTQR